MHQTKTFTVHVRATWKQTRERREKVSLGRPLLVIEPGHRKFIAGDDGDDTRSEVVGVVDVDAEFDITQVELRLEAITQPEETGDYYLVAYDFACIEIAHWRLRDATFADAPQQRVESGLDSIVGRSDVVVRDPQNWRTLVAEDGSPLKFTHEMFGESVGFVITDGIVAWMVDYEDHAKHVHLKALRKVKAQRDAQESEASEKTPRSSTKHERKLTQEEMATLVDEDF
jgi:hypothetical protein